MLKNKITIIGLGAGDLEQLSIGLYRKLIGANQTIYTRTLDHPVITSLQAEGVSFQSFDNVYVEEGQFKEVYHRIFDVLLKSAEKESLIYAVPGHPMLAEYTVQLLLEQTEVEVEISGGQSYLDDLFTSLKIDPIEGFQFLDGTSFNRSDVSYQNHLVFCQVYDRYIASEVKLALLEDLPADYIITIVEAVGSSAEVLTEIPLEELDRSIEVGNLTSVYIPPVPKELLNHQFSRLREVIATLRAPGGCEWDQAQTHESLKAYLIEETYELIEAIDAQDDDMITEELGDVLLQVMLHSQIGSDSGYFTVDDVIKRITEKMIHRHPHVFSDDPEKIQKTWDELKAEENEPEIVERGTVFTGVSDMLPTLIKARRLKEQAAKIGFEWDDVDEVWLKLDEELKEVQEAISQNDKQAIEDELGDVLFVLVDLARHYDISAELALNHANRKFIRRITHIEKRINEQGKNIYKTPLEEMYFYWNESKRKEDQNEAR